MISAFCFLLSALPSKVAAAPARLGAAAWVESRKECPRLGIEDRTGRFLRERGRRRRSFAPRPSEPRMGSRDRSPRTRRRRGPSEQRGRRRRGKALSRCRRRPHSRCGYKEKGPPRRAGQGQQRRGSPGWVFCFLLSALCFALARARESHKFSRRGRLPQKRQTKRTLIRTRTDRQGAQLTCAAPAAQAAVMDRMPNGERELTRVYPREIVVLEKGKMRRVIVLCTRPKKEHRDDQA